MPDDLHNDSPSPELLAAATAAQQALMELFQQAVLETTHDGEIPPAASLALSWSSAMRVEDLLDQIHAGLHIKHGANRAYQAGYVFCYQCMESVCEHSHPKEPGQVFAGYTNLGQPIWQEFFAELNALEERRVDQLFEKPPRLLARLVSRKHLTSQQLSAGGRHSRLYQIHGQVILGYVQLRGQREAMTVQIVETAEQALHLQVLASQQLKDALADAPPNRRSILFRIADALAKLRRHVDSTRQPWLACKTKADRGKLLAALNIQLKRFTGSLEQKSRQSSRRTAHAEQRQREQRPVHKAFDDVAAARAEHVFQDTVRESKIIVGRGGRCHVFNDQGRHMTTVHLAGDKIERRRRTKRYVQLPPADALAFKATVRRRFEADSRLNDDS